MPKVTLDMSQDDLNEIVQLAYRKWSQAFDDLKHAKAMEWTKDFCPKSDWPMFHETMIKNNTKAEQDAKRVLDGVKNIAKYNI